MSFPRFQPPTLAIHKPLLMLSYACFICSHMSLPPTRTAPNLPVTSPCLGSCLVALSSPRELRDVGLEGENVPSGEPLRIADK